MQHFSLMPSDSPTCLQLPASSNYFSPTGGLGWEGYQWPLAGGDSVGADACQPLLFPNSSTQLIVARS